MFSRLIIFLISSSLFLSSEGVAKTEKREHFVAVWEGSLAGPFPGTCQQSPDVTVRELLRVSCSCKHLRVRISNSFGTEPLTIQEAWVGLPSANGIAQLVSGSNKQLTFQGHSKITIDPGKEVWSDSVRLKVAAGGQIALSLYAPFSPVTFKFFPCFAMNPPSMVIGLPGNHAKDESDTYFPSTYVNTSYGANMKSGYQAGHIWWVDLVSTSSRPSRECVVCLGDSITEGYVAYGPPGQRWTDVLSERLNTLPKEKRLSVVNAGISGNTLHDQPNPYDPTGNYTGQPAVIRLDRDVLSVPSMKGMILLEGTNDIYGGPFAPPYGTEPVIDAMKTISDRVHIQGAFIIGGTLIPMGLPADDPRELTRLEVNRWIREEAPFDAVIDFDAMIRDPSNPHHIFPPYVTPKTPETETFPEHPNAVGHAVMGSQISLKIFKNQ